MDIDGYEQVPPSLAADGVVGELVRPEAASRRTEIDWRAVNAAALTVSAQVTCVRKGVDVQATEITVGQDELRG